MRMTIMAMPRTHRGFGAYSGCDNYIPSAEDLDTF